jgi:hypothetical protein
MDIAVVRFVNDNSAVNIFSGAESTCLPIFFGEFFILP